jgi:hypothetical protein
LHFELLSKRRACDVYARLRRKRADTKTFICTLGAPYGAQKFCDSARRTAKTLRDSQGCAVLLDDIIGAAKQARVAEWGESM